MKGTCATVASCLKCPKISYGFVNIECLNGTILHLESTLLSSDFFLFCARISRKFIFTLAKREPAYTSATTLFCQKSRSGYLEWCSLGCIQTSDVDKLMLHVAAVRRGRC